MPGREEVIVVGRGSARSAVRLEGEPHDDAARAVRDVFASYGACSLKSPVAELEELALL